MAIFSEFPNYGDLIKNAGVNIFKSVQGEIAQILPQFNPLEENEYTGYLAYPGDECYKDPRYTIKAGNRHRLYFKGRMQDFKLERNVDMTEVLNNKKSHL